LIRQQICEVGRMLWQRGLVGATEGNISVRLDDQHILCTPSGVSKGHLQATDLVVIDYEGKSSTGNTPSSEIRMHLRMYAKRADCMAVVHAHPITATGFALAGESLPNDAMPGSTVVLGPVALVPFGMPGTEDLPNTLEPFLADHKTFLLSHHGAVVMGRDVKDAYHRMEILERTAQIVLTARMLGGAKQMPPEAIETLNRLSKVNL